MADAGKRQRVATPIPLAEFAFDLKAHAMVHSTKRLGLVEIRPEAQPLKLDTQRLVLALDTSGSMTGRRLRNVHDAVHAMLRLMTEPDVPPSEVALVAFNDKARVVLAPSSPAAALANWANIKEGLYADGATNIAVALNHAMSLSKGATTVLLLTDGEDPFLVDALRQGEPILATPLKSGVTVHFVGICADADAVLLDGLAKRCGGTFVRDDDMKGLMGSMLGLVMEQIPHRARVTLLASTGEVVMQKDHLHLRVGTPMRVPFELTGPEESLTIRLELMALDTEDETLEREVVVNVTKLDAEDRWDIITAHAREWCGVAADAVAKHVANGRLEEAKTVAREALERIQPEWLGDREAPEVLVKIAEEMATQLAEMESAAADYARMRELSARAASNASTARNGGVSLRADTESLTQASMRSRSLAY